MKSKMKWMVIVAAIFAAFIGSASAQTNTPVVTAPTIGGAIDAVNTAVVDTNSSFFADTKFDLRSGLAQRGTTSADVGGDVNLWKFQVGADVLMDTSSSLVSAAQGDIGYRVPVHNLEFVPLVGGGYDWDKASGYGFVGLRFSYLVSESMATSAFVQAQLNEDLKAFSRPTTGVFVGVSRSF